MNTQRLNALIFVALNLLTLSSPAALVDTLRGSFSMMTSSWQCQIDFFDSQLDRKIQTNASLYEIQKACSEVVRSTILEGLGRIEKINPDLVYQIIMQFRGERLQFFGPNNRCGNGFAACYVKDGATEEMHFSHYAVQFLVEAIEAKLSRRPVQENQYLGVKQILFHEYLHYAKLDNLSRDEHNNLNNHDKDVVYSCALQAFPYGFAKSQQSCLTCALAVRQSSGGSRVASVYEKPLATNRCSK